MFRDDLVVPIHEGACWHDDTLALEPGCRVEVLLPAGCWLPARYLGCGSLPVVTLTWSRAPGESGPPHAFRTNELLMLVGRGGRIRRVGPPGETPPPPHVVTTLEPLITPTRVAPCDVLLGVHLVRLIECGTCGLRPVYKLYLGGHWESTTPHTDEAVMLQIPMACVIFPPPSEPSLQHEKVPESCA